MLLKNFGAYCAEALTDDTLTEGIKCTTGELPISGRLRGLPDQLGAINTIIKAETYIINQNGSFPPVWAFGFGDGTTPPTIDDYKFSGNLVVPTIISGTASNGSNGCTWQMTVINNTEEAMTINEIGLFIDSSNSGCVMLTRDVLPEPVVLQAGASKGFQIFIDTQSFVTNASQA